MPISGLPNVSAESAERVAESDESIDETAIFVDESIGEPEATVWFANGFAIGFGEK